MAIDSLERPTRLLGLDVGDRRIGFALSDPTGWLASPLEIYDRRGLNQDVEHVFELARDYDVEGFVVGLPRNMNGSEGIQAEKTREFAEKLEPSHLPVAFWDERLSTIEATRRRQERGGGKRGSHRIDAEAAALILQSFLEHRRLKERR